MWITWHHAHVALRSGKREMRNERPLRSASSKWSTIADSLQDAGISWKYYSGNRTDGHQYCAICDPLTHFASVMGDPAKRAGLVDLQDFFQDVKTASAFPAVAFVRPWEDMAGHPANSTIAAYEAFVDFFGDGTRIPLLAISPYARKGHVDHAYGDHASILKLVEWNWRLPPLSARSRDGLPNPEADDDDPYRPENGPALTDLTGLFDFDR